MYTITIEDHGRLLDIVGSGFWTLPEAKRYIADLKAAALLVRQRSNRLRAIVNSLDMPVQSNEVMELIASIWGELLTDPTDRVALIVASSLAKMQARRLFNSEHWQAFVSPSAARMWLGA